MSHLNYVGDSILGQHTNFGGGTITANLRHDGISHKTMVKDKLHDTGLRKFGTITGEYVHTGIHSSIYPGRKLWPHATSLPNETIKKDIVTDYKYDEAFGTIPVLRKNGKSKILLIKHNKGHWGFPKGHAEKKYYSPKYQPTRGYHGDTYNRTHFEHLGHSA